jgi:hypothetical protein
MDRDTIKKKVSSDPRWAQRAIVALLERQTADEQIEHATKEKNGAGFNAFDAEILTSFGKQILAGRTLSERQMAIAFKKLPKYAGQLLEIAEGNNATQPPADEYNGVMTDVIASMKPSLRTKFYAARAELRNRAANLALRPEGLARSEANLLAHDLDMTCIGEAPKAMTEDGEGWLAKFYAVSYLLGGLEKFREATFTDENQEQYIDKMSELIMAGAPL